jgi:hypothetical protein
VKAKNSGTHQDTKYTKSSPAHAPSKSQKTSKPTSASVSEPTGKSTTTSRDDAAPIQRLAPIQGDDKQVYQVYTDTSLKPGQPQVIQIVAKYKSYLRLSTSMGGDPVSETVLQAGDRSKKFSYEDDLWLVLGNGGGVDVYYDGHLLKNTSKFGERTGFVFRPSSAQ